MDNAYPGMPSDPKPIRTYEEFLMDAHWFIVMGNTAARAVLSAFLRQSTIYPTTIAYTTLDLFNWYNSNLLARRGYDRKRIQKGTASSMLFNTNRCSFQQTFQDGTSHSTCKIRTNGLGNVHASLCTTT
jgi:hypothetical protein